MVNDLKRGPDAKPKIKQRRRGNFSSYERSDKHDLSDKNKKKYVLEYCTAYSRCSFWLVAKFSFANYTVKGHLI